MDKATSYTHVVIKISTSKTPHKHRLKIIISYCFLGFLNGYALINASLIIIEIIIYKIYIHNLINYKPQDH